MSTNPLTIIAALGCGAIAVAISVNIIQWNDETNDNSLAPEPTVEEKATITKDKKINNASPKIKKLPAFDVVRVGPDGNSVIAGRAEPGSTVVIKDNGKTIGKIIADNRGEWVFLPKSPLPPGKRKLSLEMIPTTGNNVLSKEDVLLIVPEKGKDIAGKDSTNSSSLALKIPTEEGPATLLQSPSIPLSKGLSIDAIDYGDKGNIIINGKADHNTKINIYLNDDFIGQAKSNKQGFWNLNPDKSIKPGLYTLRADQIDNKGKVISRISIPFSRAKPTEDKMPKQFVIVQPGNSLWRLAYKAYGRGMRYKTIFQANKEQIKDPDLIYPGQVFTMPSENN
ncbi:MAG: LysM peptidoglycan-binding domain-containing protein [Pseudomonadota bacterium]|nr:LysM peptidoglycan-binding domain-containing protein [Pseudomonadota bacterium]